MLSLLLSLANAEITIYGVKVSPYVKIARSILVLKGKAHKVEETLPRKLLKPAEVPEILKKTPSGKIPVMKDDNFILWDSAVIARYLDDQFGNAFSSKDPYKRATIEAWSQFVSESIAAHTYAIVSERVVKPVVLKQETDEEIVETNLKALKTQLCIVEKELAKKKFLGGTVFSLADITLAAHLSSLKDSKIDMSSYLQEFKHLKKWWNLSQKKLAEIL